MANYANLKASINAIIKDNGNKEITGPALNNVLNTIVSTIGSNRTFAGIANPATVPGIYDANVFWLTSTPGVYSNFNAISVLTGELAILVNGSTDIWMKITIPISNNAPSLVFCSSATFGLNDYNIINCIKYSIREIRFYNKNYKRNIIHAFGFSGNNFNMIIANMDNKGNDDISTIDDAIMDNLQIGSSYFPSGGVVKHEMFKNNVAVGYIVMDWDLLLAYKPFVSSGAHNTTFNNAAIIDDIVRYDTLLPYLYNIQTYLFGKDSTFGLSDIVSINIVRNSIKDIYIDPKTGINTKRIAIQSFGQQTAATNFFIYIADMTDKADDAIMTADDCPIQTSIGLASIPKSGVKRVNLIDKNTTNNIVGWIEIDFSLYYSVKPYVKSGDPKTYPQAAICYKRDFVATSIVTYPKMFYQFLKNGNGTGKGLMVVYVHLKDNIYIGHRIARFIDTSEVVYVNYFRYNGSHLYTYQSGAMTRGITVLTEAESEFVYKRNDGRIDFTGGFHGDEQLTDIFFFADGIDVTNLNNDTQLTECKSFYYIEHSTMHEAAKGSSSNPQPIEGHPIDCTHIKKTEFFDFGYITRNRVTWAQDVPVNVLYGGICCTGRNITTYGYTDKDSIPRDLDNYDNALLGGVGWREYHAYNPNTSLSVFCTSKITMESGDLKDALQELNIRDNGTPTLYKKYYRGSGIINAIAGETWEAEMRVEINLK